MTAPDAPKRGSEFIPILGIMAYSRALSPKTAPEASRLPAPMTSRADDLQRRTLRGNDVVGKPVATGRKNALINIEANIVVGLKERHEQDAEAQCPEIQCRRRHHLAGGHG